MGRKKNKKEGKGFWPWWHRNKWRGFEIAIYISVILGMVLVFAIFAWSREIHWREAGYQADYDALSAAGDFAAGTLGTIVAAISVFALFRTFAYQRRVTEATMQQTELQRFNDLYFNLLSLYNRLVESLGTNEDDYSIDVFSFAGSSRGLSVQPGNKERLKTGKLYMHYVRQKILDRFIAGSDVAEDQNTAITLFSEYYNYNPGQMGALYRTIYRLLELLDQSNIPEEEKSSYSKILRAQFTESELFMLYYNSRTSYGKKMLYFVRKYHVLKHLPALSILELRKYAAKLSAEEQAEVNGFYEQLYKAISNLTDWEGNIIKGESVSDNGHCKITCKVVDFKKKHNESNEIVIKIEIARDAFIKLKNYQELRLWRREKWEQVAKDFLFVMLPIARFSHAKCKLIVRIPGQGFMFFFWTGNK